MSPLQVDAIRRRVWHSISPHTAAMAGDAMTQADLQQFIAHTFLPSDAQLRGLANYFQIKV